MLKVISSRINAVFDYAMLSYFAAENAFSFATLILIEEKKAEIVTKKDISAKLVSLPYTATINKGIAIQRINILNDFETILFLSYKDAS